MAPMRITLLILSGVLLGSTGGAQSQPAPVSALPQVNSTKQVVVAPAALNVRGPNTNESAANSTLPDDALKPEKTYRKFVDLVQVIFTVTDKHGEFVKDLKQEQFKVLD